MFEFVGERGVLVKWFVGREDNRMQYSRHMTNNNCNESADQVL